MLDVMDLRTKKEQLSFLLAPENIDLAAEKVSAYLLRLNLQKKEIIRLRLSVEEVLLSWQEKLGEKKEVQLSCYMRLGQPVIRLRAEGNGCNPLETQDDGFGEWGESLLARLETRPLYSYVGGVNIVTFRVVRPKRNPFARLLIALAAAVFVGLLGLLLPTDIRTNIAENWLSPTCDTYLSILAFSGIPLIFLSVVLGITSVGDVDMFGRIGRKMVYHFLTVSLAIAVSTALLAYPVFRFASGAQHLQIHYTDILQMLLSWAPTGLFDPFINCNAMQLIVAGVIFGVALLKLEPQGKHLCNTFSDTNSVLLQAAEWFTRLLPFFVFITIVKSIWLGQMAEILPAWKSWVATTGLQALAFLIMALMICRKYKVKLLRLLKKVSSTFLIALGTNSCVASVSDNYAVCANKLGVHNKVFGFGIPIGTTIFKPSCVIRLVVLSFYVASLYQVQVSPIWFVMVVVVAVILSIAIPAIPGGTLMFFPMLFAQLGLPAQAITPMLATDIFFDAVCTAFNQVSVQMALVQQAGKMDLLDDDMLRQ